MSASSYELKTIFYTILIWLTCIDVSHQTTATISQMIWPGSNQTFSEQQAMSSMRLNLNERNQSSVQDSFLNNEHVINSLMINPQDIQFVVPNQPDQLGQQVIQQIRHQLGSKPISLGELKNKNMSFTIEMPGIQMNRTVLTNISDETIVKRQYGKIATATRPKPLIVHSYMQKPKSMDNVYIFNNRPNYSVMNDSYLAPLPVANYSAPIINNNTQPSLYLNGTYKPAPSVYSVSIPASPAPAPAPVPIHAPSPVYPSLVSSAGYVNSLPSPPPPPAPTVPGPAYSSAPSQINYGPKTYVTNAPPLLKPKSDYASFIAQTSNANYENPNNQPKIIYRYIEVCNGKPYTSEHNSRQIESQNQLYEGYEKLSKANSHLKSSMKELEHLKQLVQYYQSLIPHLNSYANGLGQNAERLIPTVAAAAPSSSSYAQEPYSAAPYPITIIKGNGDNNYKDIGNGDIKMSYYSVEETYKTDNITNDDDSIPAEIAIY